MEVSLLLTEQILAMFLMGVLGIIIVKVGLLSSEDSKVLSKVCVYICVPFTIINSFQIERTPEKMTGILISLIVAIAYHIIYISFCKIMRKPLRLTAVERMSIIYTNVGSMIVPLVAVVFGDEMVLYTCVFMVVQTVLIWTHGKAMICHEDGNRDWKKIFANVNIIAIFIGMIMFAARVQLPGILDTVSRRMGDMIGPVSMLVVGMVIGNADLKEVFRNKRVYFICFLRLIVCPVLSILFIVFSSLGKYHPDAHTIMEVLLLAGASSSAATVTQIVQVFGEDSRYASIINVMTVILCVVTMPLMVLLYEMVVQF